MGMARRSATETKFWDRVDVDTEGHYIWLGPMQGGQPRCNVVIHGEQVQLAHRAAWMYYWQKPIPEGLHVVRRCRVAECVNPKHLVLATPDEASRVIHPRTGFCKRGHDISVVGRYSNGTCRSCGRAQANTYYQSHKGG